MQLAAQQTGLKAAQSGAHERQKRGFEPAACNAKHAARPWPDQTTRAACRPGQTVDTPSNRKHTGEE